MLDPSLPTHDAHGVALTRSEHSRYWRPSDRGPDRRLCLHEWRAYAAGPIQECRLCGAVYLDSTAVR